MLLELRGHRASQGQQVPRVQPGLRVFLVQPVRQAQQGLPGFKAFPARQALPEPRVFLDLALQVSASPVQQ